MKQYFALFFSFWITHLYAQSVESICNYLPKNCINCINKSDMIHLPIPYSNAANQVKNPLQKEGYFLVFHDEFPLKVPLDTLITHHGSAYYPVNQKGNYFPKWLITSYIDTGTGTSVYNTADAKAISLQKDKEGNENLVITIDKIAAENPHGFIYPVGNINLNGRIKYGYLEARIKVPKGRGLWPAFVWWQPGYIYQEIDLFEFFQNQSLIGNISSWGHAASLGNTWQFHSGIFYNPKPSQLDLPKKDYVSRGVYFYPHGGSCGNLPGLYRHLDLSEDFFTYAVEWNPDSIYFFCNNVMYWKQAHSMVSQAMQIGLSIGIDGRVLPNEKTVFPAKMEVDYVRVYKKDKQESFNQILASFPDSISKKMGNILRFNPTDAYPNVKYEVRLLNEKGERENAFTCKLLEHGDGESWTKNGIKYIPYYGFLFECFIPNDLLSGKYVIDLMLTFPNSEVKHGYKEIYIL